MFVVIYHWKLKEGKDLEFGEAWRQTTRAIYSKKGSLGSQLMQATDGTYYGVARWPSRDLWLVRSNPEPAHPLASQVMADLIETTFSAVELDVTDDMLATEQHT
ncbi:MAG: hypothetical protein FI716_02765 [SAR202 cluster bacterium]|nr:hypothetical protein [SAR202 cluster bacterium]|tara:strand:+ start:147 stop:458 length:312 start_codon:yes stop_codon:yes gene_type:complete